MKVQGEETEGSWSGMVFRGVAETDTLRRLGRTGLGQITRVRGILTSCQNLGFSPSTMGGGVPAGTQWQDRFMFKRGFSRSYVENGLAWERH